MSEISELLIQRDELIGKNSKLETQIKELKRELCELELEHEDARRQHVKMREALDKANAKLKRTRGILDDVDLSVELPD